MKEIHNKILKLRSYERMLNDPDFADYYDRIPELLFEAQDADKIKEWIALFKKSSDPSSMRIWDLQARAKVLGIDYWSRKTRTELIVAILEVEHVRQRSSMEQDRSTSLGTDCRQKETFKDSENRLRAIEGGNPTAWLQLA
jgi:hypothetical protein